MSNLVIRFNPKKAITFAFIALGPLGNILTPHFFPSSFRTYYFLLPFFPVFFVDGKERFAKIGIIFLPFFLYCFVSALNIEIFGNPNEPYPVLRFFLLLCQFFFILGAVSCLRKEEELTQIIKTYINFYSISLAIGWLFFIGFYLGVIPFSFIARFSVLAQFGWGMLRFSPGSYPNEYGIVSSFVLSILTLIYLDKKNSPLKFSNKWFPILFIATYLAFLLATTRAAYLSYFACLVYLIWKSGSFVKQFTKLCLTVIISFGLLSTLNLNMFDILSSGFSQKINEGSLGERYLIWIESINKAKEHPILGIGFGGLTNIHNVYLQLLFELGFIGSIILAVSLFVSLIESFFRYKRPILDNSSLFIGKIKMVGLINVLFFAASNHNLNHHLTWLVFFLCLVTLRLPFKRHLA